MLYGTTAIFFAIKGELCQYLKSGKMKTIVHVNQHVIKANKKQSKKDPCLTVKTYKDNTYAHEVVINGPCKIVYSPDKPLSCGAVCWVETLAEVIPIVHNENN